MLKKILLASVLLLSVISFTGCETKSSKNSDELSFTDDRGVQVTYKKGPKVFTDSYPGEIMYLGGRLIGADFTYTSVMWPQEKVGEVVNTGQSLDEIAKLEPDLIITYNKDLVENYEVIAPTIYVEYGKLNSLDQIKSISKMLDKESEYNEFISNYNKRIDEIKATIDHPEYTYSIVEVWGDVAYLYGMNYGRGGHIVYESLGLKATKQGEEDYVRKTESYLTLAPENLSVYVDDVLIYVTDTSQEGYENNVLTSNPTFNEINAAKNNNVYYMDNGFSIYVDPYSLDAQLDYFEELFSGDL